MMTQVVFFPFTHITQHQQKILQAFFPSFCYLSLRRKKEEPQHLKAAVESGAIEPIALADEDLESASQKTQEYMQWAKIHKGNEHNLKAILKDSAYFTSDTHVSSIKSQIKGGPENESPKSAVDMFQNNLLFLTMAHLCDEQNEQIDLELRGVDKNREKLYTALRGLDDSLEDSGANAPVSHTDTARIMTGERIAAWASCMPLETAACDVSDSHIFVTTSPSVFDYFESNCSDVVNALDIDQIKVHENNCELKNEWQHQFKKRLVRAAHGEGTRETDLPESSGCCSLSGQIKLSLFSGDMINTLFEIPDKQVAVCLVNLR